MISRHHLDFFSYGKISKSLNLRSRFPINSPAERSKAAGSKPSSQLSPPGFSKTVGDGSSHFLIGFFMVFPHLGRDERWGEFPETSRNLFQV